MDSTESSPASALKELHIPELLEIILLALPGSTILTVQRVSKVFRAGIQSSPRINRRLFFKSDPAVPPVIWGVNTKETIVALASQSTKEASKLIHTGERYVFNPILCEPPKKEICNGGLDQDLTPTPPYNAMEIDRDLWLWWIKDVLDSASCLEMFLTKPPITQIGIDLHTTSPRPFASSVITNESGIRFGDV